MSLDKFFGKSGKKDPESFEPEVVDRPAPPTGETDTVRKLVAELNAMPQDRAVWLASFAYVLTGSLTEAQAILVVQIAETQSSLVGGTDDYLVTRRFRDVSSWEERTQLLHCLFAVASAGGDTISAQESHEIREISDELGFTLPELNEVRRQYADRLAALQR
jgi:tellurite resistance protein TerB